MTPQDTPGGGRPRRIQRQRTKGWRMPEGAVYVGRRSRWGNMWRVHKMRRTWLDEFARRTTYSVVNLERGTSLGTFASEERARYWAVVGFRRDFDGDVTPLRGKDLACWCPLDQPCHADVLLELAR
jgi:hypothetical protein